MCIQNWEPKISRRIKLEPHPKHQKQRIRKSGMTSLLTSCASRSRCGSAGHTSSGRPASMSAQTLALCHPKFITSKLGQHIRFIVFIFIQHFVFLFLLLTFRSLTCFSFSVPYYLYLSLLFTLLFLRHFFSLFFFRGKMI